MSAPLQALLDHAFAGRTAGLASVRDLTLQKARAAGAREPEDLAQEIVSKLCGTAQRARALLDTLAARNAGLGATFERTPPGAVPTLEPEVRAQAEGQLAAYIARAARNGVIDDRRRERPRDALPDSDRLGDPRAPEEPSELLALRARVLGEIRGDASRPAWLEETIEAIEDLATGERTMDELTAECVAEDASLRALPAETARVRARNRLQQQHQRARSRLLAVITGMVASGALLPDEGTMAERWIHLLMRRQKLIPGPSRRSKP